MHENVFVNDDLDIPVWGAAAIAKIINREKRATYHLLESGQLDASKVGATWVSTQNRLRRSLGMEVA